MSWIIFWAIVVLYWVVAFKRLPVYYKRWYDYDRKEWSMIHDQAESQRSAAWISFALMLGWPIYESCRWARDTLIRNMTAEERKQTEYENAERIVAEYTQNKEREDREAFDRELNGR